MPDALDPRDLQAHAQAAASLLKTLANPDRLLLLCHLVDGELSVTQLGVAAGLGQPTLSQQLGVLRLDGLVATRRVGKSIFYRLKSPHVQAVLQTLHRLYCEPAPEPSLHPSFHQPIVAQPT